MIAAPLLVLLLLTPAAQADGGGWACTIERFKASLWKAKPEPSAVVEPVEQVVRRPRVTHPIEVLQESVWDLSDSGRRVEARAATRRLEGHLKTAPIAEMEPFDEGTTDIKVVKFRDGSEALFKRDTKGVLQAHWKSEVAVYELDQLMGAPAHVPVTVQRTIEGKPGALIYYVHNAENAGISDRTGNMGTYVFFDFLIDNPDRNLNNFLISTHGKRRQIAIDHGRAFRSVDEISDRVQWSSLLEKSCGNEFGVSESCVGKYLANARKRSDLIARLRAIPLSDLKSKLGPLMSAREFEMFLYRRRLLLEPDLEPRF